MRGWNYLSCLGFIRSTKDSFRLLGHVAVVSVRSISSLSGKRNERENTAAEEMEKKCTGLKEKGTKMTGQFFKNLK